MPGISLLAATSPENRPTRASKPDIPDIAQGAIDATEISISATSKNREPQTRLGELENQIMFSLQSEGGIKNEVNAMGTLIRRYTDGDEITKGKRTKAHGALFSLEQAEFIEIAYKGSRNPNQMQSITLTEEGKGYQVPTEYIEKFTS